MNRPRMHPWLPLLGRQDGRVMLAAGPRAGQGFTARDSEAVRAAARRLDGRATWRELCADPLVARGLGLLQHCGSLVDGDEIIGQDAPAEERELLTRARLSRTTGDKAAVERRRELGVTISGPAALVPALTTALRASGVGCRTDRRAPAVEVLIGRPDWVQIRRWMLDGNPHLIISPRADSIRVGPLVVPGSTSCLQCLHLVRSDRHPGWPLLWEQLQRAVVPEPDPALVQHAAALAARSLVQYAETGTAEIANACLTVAVDRLTTTRRSAPRHPLCGCWWPPAPAVDER